MSEEDNRPWYVVWIPREGPGPPIPHLIQVKEEVVTTAAEEKRNLWGNF